MAQLRRVVMHQAELLARLSSVIERLASAGESLEPVAPDPINAWKQGHRDELQGYSGQRVAIHPTRGIVAHDADLKRVVARVRELGLAEEVVIESVHPPRALRR